jgi:formate/nitrite transporter FocA (FNT family)
VQPTDLALATPGIARDAAMRAVCRRPATALVNVPAASDDDGRTSFDALLPPAMARRAEQTGVRKVLMAPMRTLALAVLAGAFIALGGAFATTAAAGAGDAPWGLVRVVVGVVFSLGLILVLVGGAELFTGNNLIVMAWASGRVGTAAVVRNWTIVFAGNALGASPPRLWCA